MYNRLGKYLTKYNLLKFSQLGFSSSSSTTTALVDVMSHINAAVSNKEYCIALYMDISKAFDCVHYLCIIFGIIFCCVYNNVAIFNLFQHVSKCVCNNFIDVIKSIYTLDVI